MEKPIAVKERHWLFGSAYHLRDNPVAAIEKFARQYGDLFMMSVPFLHRIVVAGTPEYARYVLLDNHRNYHKSLAYDILRFLLGNGLLTSEDDFWKQQRRLIQPTFHKGKLERMTLMMVEEAKKFSEEIGKAAAEAEHFDVSPLLTSITLDIISRAMFSSGVEDKAAEVGRKITMLNEYAVKKLNQPIRLPATFPTPFNVPQRQAVAWLDEVIFEIINARRNEKEDAHDDLLSMLLHARDEDTGKGMSNRQLRDEVMTIFIAGNETSANALTWILYLLSQNPEQEQKMLAEIDGKLSSGTPLTFQTLREFQYVMMVIEESLRLYPPAWVVGRRNLADDVIGGKHIPKNTNVLIPIHYLHHSEKYWEEPSQFRPERFAPEKRNSIDRYVYLPFGAGPRICVGNHFALMEMQIILIELYSKYVFRLKEGFNAEIEPLITLRPKNGMLMKAVKR